MWFFKRKNKNKQLNEEVDSSVKSEKSIITNDSSVRNGKELKSILKNSASESTLSKPESKGRDEDSKWQEKVSESNESENSVSMKRKDIRKKNRSKKGVRRLKSNLDPEHYQNYTDQMGEHTDIQDRENEIIYTTIKNDVSSFLESDEIMQSPNSPMMQKVGNKLSELLSKRLYPEEEFKLDEDGDIKYKRVGARKVPDMQYNPANYMSIPRYFHTNEGTWNTIAMHIQSNDKVSNTSLDKEYPYTEENVKDFLGQLGNFVLSRTDDKTKEEMLKHVDPEGSDAERYRHFVERKAYKTVQALVERENEQEQKATAMQR